MTIRPKNAAKKSLIIDEVDDAEESATRPSEVSTVRTFRLRLYVPPGKTYRESLEWVQKFFDYFHPSLEAKVEEEINP